VTVRKVCGRWIAFENYVCATPTKKDGSLTTLMASHRPRPRLASAITTRYFPQPHILEKWFYLDGNRTDDDNKLIKVLWRGLDGGKSAKEAQFRYNGKSYEVFNDSRDKILSTIKELRPHEFLRLRSLTTKEALRFMGV